MHSSDVRFGKVNFDGKTFPLGPRFLTLPYIFFVLTKQVKEGMVWGKDEVLPFGSPRNPLKGRIIYRVLGQREVNGANCWLILRHLSKPVTLVEDKSTYVVPLWTEWLWVDTQTGLVRRFKRRYKDYLLHYTPHPVFETHLDISLKQVDRLSPEIQRQLQSEINKIRSIAQMLEIEFERIRTSEEKLKQLELTLNETMTELSRSPYADFYIPYLERGLGDVLYWQRILEAEKLVGKPAPDFELPTVDGKGKINLSDLRGKVVLLNFFAYG